MSKRKQHNDPQPSAWHVQLSRRDEGALTVAPVAGEGQASWEPFPMPPMALSNTIWLSSLTEAIWGRRGRCMATWLILDCRRRRWLPPVIPHQRCGPDGAARRIDPRDLADLPNFCRVGGSFQTRLAASPGEAGSSVPPLDGLHLVQGISPQGRVLYLFVHVNGVTQCVEPDGAIVDDWQEAIDAHHERLELL